MAKALLLIRQDILISWREASTRFFMLVPPVLLLLLNLVVPLLLDAFPEILPYKAPLLMVFCIQGGIMFGFVSGFLLLEEKDLNLISVYRTLPLSLNQFLLMRMLFPFLGTLLFVLLTLAFNPLFPFRGFPLLLTAVNLSLLTPVLALLLAAFGRNKVEGLTYFKALDLVVLTPFLAFFLADAWQYPFMLVPTFWPVHGGAAFVAGKLEVYYLYQGIGLLVQGGIVLASMWFFQRRLER